MECLILGCGGSNGVPELNCLCSVCVSNDKKNCRTRSSITIMHNGHTLLIDTGPDLRQQALSNNLRVVDAVLYTHAHFDHVVGIGDLKNLRQNNKTIPAFMDRETCDSIVSQFGYAFSKLGNEYDPMLHAEVFSEEILFGDMRIIPFRQKHGSRFSYGFRLGDFAYSTDVSFFDEYALSVLSGVKVWVVDCMRYFYAATHLDFENTMKWISVVKPELAILTHMSHSIDYYEMRDILPDNVVPAFDGMRINLNYY